MNQINWKQIFRDSTLMVIGYYLGKLVISSPEKKKKKTSKG